MNVTARSWDPFHGDLNNRHPKLGAERPRSVPRESWTDFRLTQPAIYNNGIFGPIGSRELSLSFFDRTRGVVARALRRTHGS